MDNNNNEKNENLAGADNSNLKSPEVDDVSIVEEASPDVSKKEKERLEEAAKELDKIETISVPDQSEEENAERTIKKAKRDGKTKKKFHWWIILVAVLLVALVLIVALWFVFPSKTLNVVVLNKTVLTLEDEDVDYSDDSLYRKHQGLFWLLNQQKYVKEDGSQYRYKVDYCGAKLDEDGKLDFVTELYDVDSDTDLLYIADLYGAIDDDYGYYHGSIGAGSGLTSEDMMEIYSAHESGATIVAEMETFHTSLSDSVSNQLQALCGITTTSWLGRYVSDLADLTDVPDWAPPLYFQQEGVEWQFSGPGIILISQEYGILVLEQKEDFESSDLLRIYVNDAYKKEFGGMNTCDFYNWFELVEANAGTEVVATFEFDVNAQGMEKLKEFNSTPRFAAITRKTYENGAPVYYFAGDFNDYVSKDRIYQFLFADSFYRLTTYERQGDITNFYWNFYNPLMKKILADAYDEAKERDSKEKHELYQVSMIDNDKLAIYGDDSYHPLSLNCVSINASSPGTKSGYSNDRDYYSKLIAEAVELGANTVYAKDLLPPEFYSAVYENNKDASRKIYIIQGIEVPSGVAADNCTSSDAAWNTSFGNVVAAIHGNISIKGLTASSKNSYKIDVSEYVIGFVINTGIDSSFIDSFKNSSYTYTGTYASGNGLDGYIAYLYDTLEDTYVSAHNGFYIPIGINISPETINGTAFAVENSIDISAIVSGDYEEHYSFLATSLNSSSSILSDKAMGTIESDSRYAYALSEISNATENKFLITNITVSVNVSSYSNENEITEREQGNQIVNALKAVDSFDSVGGVVFDLNDDWASVSEEYTALMSPAESIGLWKNVTDPAQTTGLVSVEEDIPSENEMILADDDRMQHMYFSSNTEYLYITLELLTDIEYGTETMFLGIDTYQRNDGEYYYASDFVATSLSGMEYVIRFDESHMASLWVIKDYDRSKGGTVTKESYTGSYNKVADLTYGGFGVTQNQFYQTGSTLYIRIPWMWLNITDPSQRMVLNDTDGIQDLANVTSTNGILFSLMIGDNKTKDVLYQFPEQKSDPGYKTYKWTEWTEVKDYILNERDSFDVVQNYFSGR